MSPEQIDRSVLAGKDRDELHTIASAIGVKAATRMRKADLVEAIMGVVEGGNGNGEQSETAGKGPEKAPRASSRAAKADNGSTTGPTVTAAPARVPTSGAGQTRTRRSRAGCAPPGRRS